MPLKDPIKRRAWNRLYEQRNTERAKERCRKYRLKNPEKYRELCRIRARLYYKRHTDKALESAAHATRKKLYGITKEKFLELMAQQKGLCAICGRAEESSKLSLAVDHDHKTGRVRALLCSKCNPGLGMFRDSPELLIAASKYLVHHSTAPLITETNTYHETHPAA